MKKYDKYKNSKTLFIGKIPISWDITKLKWLLKDSLKYGANEAADQENKKDPRYIRITDFGKDGNLKNNTFKSLPNKLAQEYLLENGDILFARSGATVGKTFQFKNYTGKACYAGYLIKASPNPNKLNTDFLYFYTKSGCYESWKNSIFIQATIQNIGADKYSTLPIPLPPLKEQTQIANFLDEKTAEIDEAIALKNQLIALLQEEKSALINEAVTKGIDPTVPMKDSGIEWIGDIPAHWEIIQMKYLGFIKYGLGQPPKQLEGGLPIIRATNVSRGIISEKNMMYVDPNDLPYERDPILQKNDIIVVRSGAYTADSAIIPKKYTGAVTGYDMVFRATKIFPQFIAYGLLSNYILFNQLYMHRMRAAQPHLNAEELGATLVLSPPKKEQIQIAQYIDKKTQEIDQEIDYTKEEIALLKEYRQSLISEAVTGKIDVRK